MSDDQIRTRSNARYIGFELGRGILMATWSGDEFVFGLRWTGGYFGICLGPLGLGYCWQNVG
jgi:hypothetical protein